MNTTYFDFQLKSHRILYFPIIFTISLLVSSYIKTMDGFSKAGGILTSQKQLLQDLLDKKIPFVVKKESCTSKRESFVKVIPMANVNEVEYLNNHQIAIRINENKHFMIDLCSNEQWEFSKPFMKLDYCLPKPENIEKVAHWEGPYCVQIRISEGFPYSQPRVQRFDGSCLCLPIYTDENRLPVIWVKKDKYYYKNGYPHSCSHDVDIYKAGFQSSLDPDGIISQYQEKFTIYYDRNQLVFKDSYGTSPREILYLYSPAKHFIIKYAPKTSYYAALCTIIYPGDRDAQDLLIDPCSMVLHPTNKDVFGLMLGKERTVQYWNSQGVLLAMQTYPMLNKQKPQKKFSFGNYLSFSPDGMSLAAIFPEKEEIVFFRVPFRVHIDQKKLHFILFCLKNQKILSSDVVGLLYDIFCS